MVGKTQGIIAALDEGGPGWRFPSKASQCVRMIDEATLPVIVPLGGGHRVAGAELACSRGSPGRLLRRLKPYTVGIPARAMPNGARHDAISPPGGTSAMPCFRPVPSCGHLDPGDRARPVSHRLSAK